MALRETQKIKCTVGGSKTPGKVSEKFTPNQNENISLSFKSNQIKIRSAVPKICVFKIKFSKKKS